VDLTAEDFFEALCQDMIGRGTNSRELVALEFDPESGEISVIGGAALHAASYPPLKTILEMIGKACVADGIAVLGLRRITLLEEQITVEWLSRTGRWKTIRTLLNKRHANCPVRRFVCSSGAPTAAPWPGADGSGTHSSITPTA
jgi:hypothetical protein